MKRSNRILILIGVFLAAIAFFGVVLISSNSNSPSTSSATSTPTAEPKTPVVVAGRDIALGETISDAMVTVKQVTLSQAAAYGTDTFSSLDQVRGKIAASEIQMGDPLHNGVDFFHPIPGAVTQGQDISSSIDPGYVAISMEIDQINGVGTLIVPGDHVDVILSVYVQQIALAKVNNNGTPISIGGGTDVTSKMIFQNCKIIATLAPPATPAASPAPGVAGTSPTPVPTATAAMITNNGQHIVVIIQVKPDQAEVIRWAQRAEKSDPQNYIDLALALRSPKDNDAADVTTLGVTFSELVTRYGVLPLDPRGVIPAHLADGIKW